jgi:hypothetical protein
LKDLRADDLGAIPLRALMARHPQIDVIVLNEAFAG